jgi:Putative addiction module component
MIAEADIQNMTTAEKLETISRLWDSLEEDVEPPAWHQKVLEERLRKIDAGEETFYSLEESRAILEERKRQRQS